MAIVLFNVKRNNVMNANSRQKGNNFFIGLFERVFFFLEKKNVVPFSVSDWLIGVYRVILAFCAQSYNKTMMEWQ